MSTSKARNPFADDATVAIASANSARYPDSVNAEDHSGEMIALRAVRLVTNVGKFKKDKFAVECKLESGEAATIWFPVRKSDRSRFELAQSLLAKGEELECRIVPVEFVEGVTSYSLGK